MPGAGAVSESRTDQVSVRSKVFGIGLNKTGTTSLKRALEHLGYRVCGNSKALMRLIRQGEIAPAIERTRHYDAFQDWPWPLIFEDLHREYGNDASYILTRRSSFERWFASIENHARSSRLFSGQWLAYGYYRPFGRAREYEEIYHAHNEAVRQYFTTGPGADAPFLEICLDEGDGWDKLCAFLGLPVPEIAFPHANPSERRKVRFPVRYALNRIVEPVCRAYARRS